MSDSPKGKKPNTGINFFKLSGTVKRKDFKFSANGKPFCTVQLSVPAKNPKFSNTFFLKIFKEKAQEFDDSVNDGAMISFTGYISNSSYLDKKTGQKVYSKDFIVNNFEEAVEEVAQN